MNIKSTLSFLVILLLLQGCGGKNSDRLNGVWLCDPEATVALMEESKSLTEAQFQAAVAVLQGMSLEIIGKTKTLIIRVGSTTETAPFTVSVQGRNTFLLELASAKATAELKGRDTLHLTDSRTPGRTVVFKRQK